MIEVKRYCIGNQGDESAEIQPQLYYIEGPLFFKDEIDRLLFEDRLRHAFVVVCAPGTAPLISMNHNCFLFECDQDGYRV